MANTFPSDPAHDAVAVTPSDATQLGGVRGLYVGGAGDVAVEMQAGTTLTFAATAGGVLPIKVKRVLATGTTATGIIALK